MLYKILPKYMITIKIIKLIIKFKEDITISVIFPYILFNIKFQINFKLISI